MRPMSWYCGSQETFTVLWSAASSLMISDRLCARFRWVIITPLGSEVEPEVYCRKATSDMLIVLARTTAFLGGTLPFFNTSST